MKKAPGRIIDHLRAGDLLPAGLSLFQHFPQRTIFSDLCLAESAVYFVWVANQAEIKARAGLASFLFGRYWLGSN
jgi:hypothetical protein